MTTFSESLAQLSPDELRALISARPDAFFPAPPSVASLATRLTLPGSAAKAVRQLSAADLAVLEKLADAGGELEPTNINQMSGAMSTGSLDTLRRFALIYGPDDALRITPGTLTALPPGWRITDTAPEGLEDTLDELSSPERKVLDTLAASGGVGTTRMAAPDADPKAPIPTLIAKGLLIRVDANTVRLPRPVRDAVRGLPPRVIPLTRPETAEVDQSAVDEAATTQGLDAVRQIRQLITVLLKEPVVLNKDGSVGIRAVANLAKQLGFDPSLLVTIGESAGLIGRGNADDNDVLAATRDALSWTDAPVADQWAILLAGWVASPWRTDSDARLLSDETRSPDLRNIKLAVLRSGGQLDHLLFTEPLRAASLPQRVVDKLVEEATFVGALAPAPSSPLRALIDGTDIAAATHQLVPPAVDTLIAQADLTVLAPGPLEPGMAAFLEGFAELESPGVATVWRVTEDSVKRALDSGTTAAELNEWLAEYVLGDVPQGLNFLIEDVARTHGAIRAGAAMSYIRSADPSLIATAADKLGEATLRVLAPTVAVSRLPLPKLMAQLRAAGLQPTAEDDQGAQLNLAPEPVLVAPTPSHLPKPAVIAPEHVEQIVARLGDGSDEVVETTGATLETLRAAARGRRHVTLGYVDKNGRGHTMTVLPLSVSDGQVDALDESSERVVRIALPRITKVAMS